MKTEQSNKTYEVGFSTEKFQHIFYISCPDDDEAKTFAHAVFHYYDTPEEWGAKRHITAIGAIKPTACLPDFLYIGMEHKNEVAMPQEDEESHREVRKLIKQALDDGHFPMAIYNEERKVMTVYAAKKLDAAPLERASSVVQNFSNFGGMPGKGRK